MPHVKAAAAAAISLGHATCGRPPLLWTGVHVAVRLRVRVGLLRYGIRSTNCHRLCAAPTPGTFIPAVSHMASISQMLPSLTFSSCELLCGSVVLVLRWPEGPLVNALISFNRPLQYCPQAPRGAPPPKFAPHFGQILWSRAKFLLSLYGDVCPRKMIIQRRDYSAAGASSRR